MKKKTISGLLVLGLSLFIFWGCNMGSQKSKNINETSTENMISAELHQEHCDLLAKANEELAGINKKVRELNDKIREKGGKFSDAQNIALDNFEEKQISINKRMHEIKNVKQEDWENFKATFEKDLAEINTIIDSVLKEF